MRLLLVCGILLGLSPRWVGAQTADTTPADTLVPALRVYAGWPTPTGPRISLSDSLSADSARTLRLPSADSLLMSLDDLHRWDEALELPGFVQHTGIIGKPVQQLYMGLQGRYLHQDHLWQHPLSGQLNPYFFLPERTPVFDAHRPLVHVHFNQSSFNTQLLRVTLSQNLRPWYNTTLHYRRRTATGLYGNQVTDHYNVYWNHWMHSRDFRWQLFAGLLWQEMTDGLNGGIAVEGGMPLQDAFEGISTPIQLTNTSLYQRHRSAWARAYGQPLSWLGIHLGGQAQDFMQVLADPTTYTAVALNSTLFRPYPQLLTTEAQVGYGYTLRTYSARGGVAISSQAPLMQDTIFLEAEGYQMGLPLEVMTMPQSTLNRYALTARWHVHLQRPVDQTPILFLSANYCMVDNNLQDPTSRFQAQMAWYSRPRTFALLDSSAIDTINYRIAMGLRKPKQYRGSWVPWQASISANMARHNPSLVDAYWQGATFAGNAGLTNELVIMCQAKLRHTWGAPRMRRGLAYRQNYLELGAFVNEVVNPVYYTERMQAMQTDSTRYGWLGVSLAQQQRLGRFYLLSQVTAQQGRRMANAVALEPYINNSPGMYGMARLFWEAKLFRTPADFQIGVEATGFTAYQGFALDPALQQWYPQYTQELPAYLRLDAWFALRIQRTFIYVKMLHANQGLAAPGYFTAPFHPMQPRAFNFGVSWQFSD